MKYFIAIEPGTDDTAFGVVVPDLPGCFSSGDTLEEAIDNANEAAKLWLETVIDDGGTVPSASSFADLQTKNDYKGWIWAVINIDLYDNPTRQSAY